jgi:hypothetical protein
VRSIERRVEDEAMDLVEAHVGRRSSQKKDGPHPFRAGAGSKERATECLPGAALRPLQS